MSGPAEPITVIVLSRNRALYLWACLDSLYRATRHPARFVLVDNASDDPAIRRVVAGFERRGMLAVVEWHATNSPKRVAEAIAAHRHAPGRHLVIVESDVVVAETEPCWLSRMSALMDAHPRLGILGSYIDGRDFVDPVRARQLEPDFDEYRLGGLIKAASPERRLAQVPPDDALIRPFNPPGRLIMVRKDIIDAIPFGTDAFVHAAAQAAGIDTAIATQVRHRHLSLLNLFDYPDYDVRARDDFIRANQAGSPIPASGAAPREAGPGEGGPA
jgi:hypothetical protein